MARIVSRRLANPPTTAADTRVQPCTDADRRTVRVHARVSPVRAGRLAGERGGRRRAVRPAAAGDGADADTVRAATGLLGFQPLRAPQSPRQRPETSSVVRCDGRSRGSNRPGCTSMPRARRRSRHDPEYGAATDRCRRACRSAPRTPGPLVDPLDPFGWVEPSGRATRRALGLPGLPIRERRNILKIRSVTSL